ncbi:hypothetical protein RQP46_008910 [Phenoliferia psychrophenolica]
MGLFSKSRKEQIPEVQQPVYGQAQGNSNRPGNASISSAAPSYRSNAPAYVPPSQGGGGYGGGPPQQQPPYGQQERQGSYGSQASSQSRGPYSRGGPNGGGGGGAGQRDELLKGAPPPRAQQSQGGGQYGNDNGGDEYSNQGQQQEEDPEEEEVEGIKQQMRFVKQESLASTRNAVRIAREAEETARATLDKLGDQSDRFANTENHLDMAKTHNSRAIDETKELEALNRSIFRPNMTWNKAKKRDKEEQRILDRHNAEKEAREDTRREQYESQQRIQDTYKGMDRAAENAHGAKSRAKARGNERQRYQFEATGSDDEVEDEIDENLDELGGLAGRLKMLATTAGQQVDAQNSRLRSITDKVDNLDTGLVKSTQRLARVK